MHANAALLAHVLSLVNDVHALSLVNDVQHRRTQTSSDVSVCQLVSVHHFEVFRHTIRLSSSHLTSLLSSLALTQRLSSLALSPNPLVRCTRYAYTRLPLDLIPDWVPLIGELDDGVARLVMVVGVVLLICGLVLAF